MKVINVSKGSIFRRTGSKNFIIQLLLTFEDGSTRRISRSAKTKKEAKDTLQELQSKVLQYNEVNNPPPQPTRHKGDSFVDYLEGDYLREKELVERCSPRTVYATRNSIRKHIKPALGNKRANEITPQDIVRLYADMGTQYSPSTVRKVGDIISNAFRKLMRDGKVDKSPTEFVKKPSVVLYEKKPLTEEEIKRLFQAAAVYHADPWVKNQNMPVYLKLALATGMRRGELCALKWEHIDWEHGFIEVKKAIAYLGNKMQEKSTKTGKSRSIAVSPNILDMLRMHKLLRAQGEYVFPDRDDKNRPQNPETVRHAFDVIRRLSGIERLSGHLLRHTNISIMGAAGIDIRTIAERAGHSQLTTTMRYLHTNADLNRRAGDVFKDI